jgi:hypothetical protein
MDEGLRKDNESTSHHPFSLSSTIYKRLNWTFLVGYTLVAGNYTNFIQSIFNQTFF